MARVRRARPELDAREVLRLYVGLVPGLSYGTPASFMENKVARCPGLSGQTYATVTFAEGLKITSKATTRPNLS